MEKMNVYEVTKKLCGDIEPVGDSSIDEDRLENLLKTISTTDKLIDDIIDVSRHLGSQQCSVHTAGNYANIFIDRLKERLNEN